MLVTQSCPSLWDPRDYSPPDFSVHVILQARILEWIAVPFSKDLPDPGIEPWSPALQVDLFYHLSYREVCLCYDEKKLTHTSRKPWSVW